MTKQSANKPAIGFNISNWPFTIKFMAPAAVATAVMAILTGGAIYVMNGQGQTIDRINNVAMPEIVKIADIKADIKEANGDLYNALLTKATNPGANASADVAKVTEDLGKISDRVKQSADSASDPTQKKQLNDLNKEVKTYKEAVEFAGSVMDVDFASVGPMMSQFDDGYAKMSELSDKIIAGSKASAAKAAADAKAAQAAGISFLTIFAVIMTCLSGGIAFLFSRLTVNGINRIAKTTEELANGNLNVDIQALARRDELKSVVDSLNVFKSNAEEKERLTAIEAATAKTREERARQMSELAERFRHEAQDMLDALSNAA